MHKLVVEEISTVLSYQLYRSLHLVVLQVEDALAHPYLEQYYDPEDEPVSLAIIFKCLHFIAN
jgi:hypothetical protein